MKTKTTQLFAKKIREFGFVFEPERDAIDNAVWVANTERNNGSWTNYRKGGKLVLILNVRDQVWTCHLEDRLFTDNFVSFKHPNTEQAVEDCLKQVIEALGADVRYYGERLGVVA